MNTPLIAGLQGSALIAPKKKRVLLVDTSRLKRDLRSETMRRLGAEVDCAADIAEARCWWRPNLYDLVLIHAETGKDQTDRFCGDMRSAMPSQQVMFLVGKPEYLAASPKTDQTYSLFAAEEEEAYRPATPPIEITGDLPQVWGIFEACRRISAVRCAADARTKAMRDRPAPRRDSEPLRSPNDRSDDLKTSLTELQERDYR